MTWRIGIDTGGTFTDVVAIEHETGATLNVKVASTPEDPVLAVLDGVRRLDLDPAEVTAIVLGTTLATNAALQRQGALLAYVTTQGFEDIPHIQRSDKPDPYNLQWIKPKPLVWRRHCFGVHERIGPEGDVITALDDDGLVEIGEKLDRWVKDTKEFKGERAIAVNLLFSFANASHEKRLGAYLRQRYPGISVSLSSAVSPLWREYERASTTLLDAFTKPLLRDFLLSLREQLLDQGYQAPLSVMKSNGGQMLAEAAAERPVQFLLSGLAGGVIAGRAIGQAHGFANVITLDMGGTSTDVAVAQGGVLAQTTEYELEFSLPVSIPSLDVRTIGAGGGSIAWIDKGGLLKVGPHSAGAVPGPACYGLGGTQPTVTDANLVLGRLGPNSLLGGSMTLEIDAASAALDPLAERLGLSLEDAASSIIAIANENMVNAIRVLTVERGINPSEFALVAFGGAGPLHAAEIAQSLEIKHVVIPANPGLASALGTLLTSARVDIERTFVRHDRNIDDQELECVLDDMETSARAEFKAEGHQEAPTIERSVAMRYAGQSHELAIAASDRGEGFLQRLIERFHERHETSYGYRFVGERTEVTGCAVTAIGSATTLPKASDADATSVPRAARSRSVFHAGALEQWPVQMRGSHIPGTSCAGPLIVEGYDAAIMMPPGLEGRIAEDGALMMSGMSLRNVEREPTEPVSLGIINNALVNICREMGTAMIRTAYSPIFNESRDFSCALFDLHGEMLAQGEYCPAQLGAIIYTVKQLLAELGDRQLEAGDVIIHNDPYRGGCHMPEHLMVRPIYVAGRLHAYAAIIAHMAEIGGMVVGSFAATATEVFQEGLRLPPVLLMRRGERVQEVWDIMLANHRTPRHTWGDLHAMLGALDVAHRRYAALVTKYSAPFFQIASRALLDHAERWMRREISAIPDGVYECEDLLEDDGVRDRPIRMHVKVTVDGTRFIADFLGSDDQALGPVNATRGVTMSAVYNALYQLADNAIPRNGGCYRHVEVITRKGSVLDVAYPGPSVGGNTETQPRIVFLVLGALSKAIPHRVSATEGCTACNFLIGGDNPKSGEYFAHYHFEGGGWGGRSNADGNDVLNHVIGNCRITPLEVFETRFPVTILSYGLIADSGGAGRHRGGLASRRVIRVEADEMRASLLMDHARLGPRGLFGGKSGRPASVSIKRLGDDEFRQANLAFGTTSASKFADIRLKRGDEVTIESCGGAGYGNASERTMEAIKNDLEEGFVTRDHARAQYGWSDAPPV